MKNYENLAEEDLKTHIWQDYFAQFEIGTFARLDFTLKQKNTDLPFYLLWAEAKKSSADILNSFTQLVLTIGVNTDLQNIPKPPFLAVFDSEKIAFIEYAALHYFCDSSLFNEISWQNITPSNHLADEFIKTKNRIQPIIKENAQIFYFEENDKELKDFILNSLSKGELNPVVVTDKNFDYVYSNWYLEVWKNKVIDFDVKKENSTQKKLRDKMQVLESDFFLADLISENDKTLEENLLVLLNKKENGEKFYKVKPDFYELKDLGDLSFKVEIIKPEIHTNFWKMYKRPPEEQFWTEIFNRRDKLAPKDIRERKGAFFTPAVWVKKAQDYLKDALGDNWEENYYIWDCAAGTGNLLVGLKNPARIFASTIDSNDVVMMKQIIKIEKNNPTAEKLDLLEQHIFQFDFLNDDFSKLPENLQHIIQNESDKLIIFINPPYAEATSATTPTGTGANKALVARDNKMCEKYRDVLGKSNNELFAQFFIRIYKEIPNCILASFSTLKYINASSFAKFRQTFLAKFLKGFVCPAFSFDNVQGKFPIGFLVWNTKEKNKLYKVPLDLFDEKNLRQKKKKVFYNLNGRAKSINKWLRDFSDNNGDYVALLDSRGTDFQNQQYISIKSQNLKITAHSIGFYITKHNLIPACVYFAVRKAIAQHWTNNRDQFWYPNQKWLKDKTFCYDCFIFSLFHGKNRISAQNNNVNHFIAFSEKELHIDERFKSHFLMDFMAGKIKIEASDNDFFEKHNFIPQEPMVFSNEAQNVLNAAKALYIYYHQTASIKKTAYKINDQLDYLKNAALYDIKEFFQGRNDKGRMNPKSEDLKYTELLNQLKETQRILALKITPKIYEYGFLLE